MENEQDIEQINRVYEYLKEVIDPELLVNIVDLGLVYKVELSSKTKNLIVSHTLTSMGCPMGDLIDINIKEVLNREFPDFNITVQLIWTPKWTPDMMNEEAKLFPVLE